MKLDICYKVKKEPRVFPEILPGLTRMIEFLSSETEKTSGGEDFLGKIQNSIWVSLTLRYLVNIQETDFK